MFKRLELLTAGESHGKSLTVILLGMPAGLRVSIDRINRELRRRQSGYGRGERMRIESDVVEITAGVRGGVTLGSPIAMTIENRDWVNWEEAMSPEPGGFSEEEAERRAVYRPRPGHVDLAGGIKYGHLDMRNVLERASARETAARVAAGAVAKQLLELFEVRIRSYVIRIGPVEAERSRFDLERVESSPVRCPDPEAEAGMIEAIDRAEAEGDSLGGVFEVAAENVPPGLGSHVHWHLRLDTRLAAALMSIPAVKGVEIGLGFKAAELPGSRVHDEILYSPEKGLFRGSNNAGGIEGGISNGEPIIVRAAVKPIPTLKRPLRSVDLREKTACEAAAERSDVCVVPAAGVVGEAMVALVLADAMIEKFGGDHIDEMRRNFESYMERVSKWLT